MSERVEKFAVLQPGITVTEAAEFTARTFGVFFNSIAEAEAGTETDPEREGEPAGIRMRVVFEALENA